MLCTCCLSVLTGNIVWEAIPQVVLHLKSFCPLCVINKLNALQCLCRRQQVLQHVTCDSDSTRSHRIFPTRQEVLHALNFVSKINVQLRAHGPRGEAAVHKYPNMCVVQRGNISDSIVNTFISQNGIQINPQNHHSRVF